MVRLQSGKLPALDGHEETTVDGRSVAFEPILRGSTVLVAGTGGMKTVRMLDFLQRAVVPELEARVVWRTSPRSLRDGYTNADLPFVLITSRINLAHKIEADLTKRGIGVHNYKNKPSEVKMEEWLNHPWVIISIEQLEKLESWVSTYQDGTVVFDEVVTGASSIVNGVTVRRPSLTTRTLRKLVDVSSYFIVMDADFDADGKGKTLLEGVACKKSVLFVQTTMPSLKTTVMYGYSRIPEHKAAFEERLELSCLTSDKNRRDGTAPNRTYIGEDWPSDVNKRCVQVRGWGVGVKGLHGKLGAGVRKEALKDLDAFVEDADAFVVTNVAGIGTDQNCKYRAGFLRLKSGDHAPGPRSAAQKIGRLNRNSDNPLDTFTAPDGTVYDGGVVYVLLLGLPPSLDSTGDPRDRAARKLGNMRGQVDERRSAVLSMQSDAERRFEHNNGTYLQQGGGEFCRLPSVDALDLATSSDAATLTKLEALNNIEDDDKQCNSYTVKFFELMALPSRSFTLAPVLPLSESEQTDLDSLRGGQKGDECVLTEDEKVGEMTPREQFLFVKECVEADGDFEPDSRFWNECYGMCETGKARHEGSNIDEAFIAVWGTLKDYKMFPQEEVYTDLFNDTNANCVLHRGMMRFLSVEEIRQSEMLGLERQVLSDPTTGELRPLYKLKLLKEFACILQLDLTDLLEPRIFTPSKHAWAAAHNHLIDGTASEDEKAMARQLRLAAIQLGCTGIRHGERVKKPTSVLETVHKVLTQRCAMRPPDLRKNTSRSPIHSWEVKEAAPGWAELGLHWHRGLQQKVPLGEYDSHDARWKAREEEEKRSRKDRAARAATQAMLDQFSECEEEIEADAFLPAVPYIAPHDPNVLYVPYEGAALQECLRAFKADEPQREAADNALFDLIAKRAAIPGVSDDDAGLLRMREWKKALNRLETRHRIATELDLALTVAATDGPLKGARIAREVYSGGDGRRYAKGDHWVDDDGKRRSVSAQGMPADLRTKLLGWRFADKDGRKSDLTIYVIVASLLGLQRSKVNVLVDEYLKTDEVCKAWHDGVAEHHGTHPEEVKRWPNILGNGGSYKTCLTGAGLPLDSPSDARVERMEKQLKKLRQTIVSVSRELPNALWPGSENFVHPQHTRLLEERPNLKGHERFNKIFAYLVQTAEDILLGIHARAQRTARRDALGGVEFDALPPELRDTGVLCFDGLVTERAGDDTEAGDRAAEAAFVKEGWHAQSWGIEYKIVEKPMFGEQHVDPDEFESAKRARRALQEAAAAYPEVRQAVENPAMHRGRASPAASRNASVIPVFNGRALLIRITIEGVTAQKYGLIGGKGGPGETLAETAAREVSGRVLRNAIAQLEPAAFKECRAASMHIAVATVGTEDASSSKHVEWVDIAKLLDHQWRKLNMHQGVVVAAVRETLQKHLVTGKRSRDSSSDLDDDAMADALDAAMAERNPKRPREAAMTSAEGFA